MRANAELGSSSKLGGVANSNERDKPTNEQQRNGNVKIVMVLASHDQLGNTGCHPIFTGAKSGEYVTQVTAIGPLGLEYIDAKDDPRNESP